jgi:hypothetical protein
MDPKTSQNAEFITLIQVASENREMGKRLKAILSMDSFNRKSMLNTWIEELRMKQAPASLITSLAFLLDDKIAETAFAVIAESIP